MNINEGNIQLEVAGVTNLPQLKEILNTNLEIYRDLIWTEETRAEIKETIEVLKKDRTKLKKVAATFNKNAALKVREKYDEIKEIEHIFDEIINPLEQKEKDFLEMLRLKRLEQKRNMFAEKIQQINMIIGDVNVELDAIVVGEIVFDEDWANLKIDKIDEILNEKVELIKQTRQTCIDKISHIETICKLYQNEYSLKSKLDYKMLLGNELYTLHIESIRAKLESYAESQAVAECEIQEKVIDEIENKIIPETKSEGEKYIVTFELNEKPSERLIQQLLKDYYTITNITINKA